MIPNKSQFSDEDYHGGTDRRPDFGYLSRWVDENKREKAAKSMANTSVEDLEKQLKEAEAKDSTVKSGQAAAPTEMSGDALSRAKAGKPAKTDFQVRKDLF